MATRTTEKSNPTRELALELTKAALASGALERQPTTGTTPAEQSRLDAVYVARLFWQVEQRLKAFDAPK